MDAKAKVYKERFATTPLGQVRIWFGRGKRPDEREITYSNHLQEHRIWFQHKGCNVKIKTNKDASSWDFTADKPIRFREEKDLEIHVFYMKFEKMTAEQAMKIGEELAETLVAETAGKPG